MAIYNLMTCSGTWSTKILGGCSQGWLVLAFIFLLAMIIRKQTDDGALSGVPYNVIGGVGGGLLTAIIIITFTGAAKWGFLGGIGGIIVGGFLLGIIFGDGGGE